jgi:recombination protein RecA
MRALDLSSPRVTPSNPSTAPAWRLPDLSGRLVELSAGRHPAHLTAAFGLVLEAQLAGDQAAWITLDSSSFFPPDAADGGIDLEALPIVRVPDAAAAGRAADYLVRSGGFGLVALDLPHAPGALSAAMLTRLLGLARTHDAVILILTRKTAEAPSVTPLVSLRAEASRAEGLEGPIAVHIHALKDKRAGPGWVHVEACHGTAGLR